MTQREIADRTGVSARTVWAAIAKAEARGELDVYGYNQGRRIVITAYRLHKGGRCSPSTRNAVTEAPPSAPPPAATPEAERPSVGELLRRLI